MAIPSLASAEPPLPNETTLTVVPTTPTTLPIPPDTTVTPDTTQIQTVTPTPTSIPTVVTTVTTLTTIPTTPVTTLPVTTIATTPITTPTITTPVTIVTQPTTTITSSSHTPPSLLINPPTINQLKITVDGTSTPGEFGQTITRISWNWGDGRIEDQQFPASHTYARAGRYVVTATSYQSDGTFNTRNFEAEVSPPSVTTTVITTTQPLPGAPRLILNAPEINNSTVLVNGISQTGSPSMTIQKLQVDWGDQKREEYAAFPFQHTYTSPGQYQIWVTGVQSDGQSTIQNLTVEISSQVPGTLPTTPVTPGPGPFWTRPGIVPGLLVVLAAVIVGGGALLWRRRDLGSVVIPTSEPLEEAVAAYTRAREQGDLVQARKSAMECAQLLVILAEAEPQYSAAYLEKADDWKGIARSLTQHLENEQKEEADQSPVISLEKNGSHGTAEVGEEMTLERMSAEVLEGTDIEPTVFEAVMTIALEIAREGREGQAVGTAFIVGDSDRVMNASTQFILNPFKGHQIEERLITDVNLHENIKEFSLLDGAFIIASDGAVEAAGRYITVDTSGISLPSGLGSRHASAAGITRVTNSVGVVVSQSGGLIKVIKGGKILWTITP